MLLVFWADCSDQFLTFNRIDIEFRFEKAYCLYRLNKTQEALDILNAIAEPTQAEKELKAQVVRSIFLSRFSLLDNKERIVFS